MNRSLEFKEWSADLAYVVGLITSDGNLSSDGRHLNLTSKDLQQIENFKKILKLTNKIGKKGRGGNTAKDYYCIQFGNVIFYRFLESIGLCPNKSKKLTEIFIPDCFFIDFFRGCFDGDGFSYSYWDKRWKSSFMFYTGLVSASRIFLDWVREKIENMYNIKGYINSDGKSAFQLLFAKKNSIALVKELYYSPDIICLERKRYKIKQSLGIIAKQ